MKEDLKQCSQHLLMLNDTARTHPQDSLATLWASRCDDTLPYFCDMMETTIGSHSKRCLVILGTTASGAGHLQTYILSIVLAKHCWQDSEVA